MFPRYMNKNNILRFTIMSIFVKKLEIIDVKKDTSIVNIKILIFKKLLDFSSIILNKSS